MKINKAKGMGLILLDLGWNSKQLDIFIPHVDAGTLYELMGGKLNGKEEVNTYEVYKLLIPIIGYPKYTGKVFDIPNHMSISKSVEWVNSISNTKINAYAYSRFSKAISSSIGYYTIDTYDLPSVDRSFARQVPTTDKFKVPVEETEMRLGYDRRAFRIPFTGYKSVITGRGVIEPSASNSSVCSMKDIADRIVKDLPYAYDVVKGLDITTTSKDDTIEVDFYIVISDSIELSVNVECDVHSPFIKVVTNKLHKEIKTHVDLLRSDIPDITKGGVYELIDMTTKSLTEYLYDVEDTIKPFVNNLLELGKLMDIEDVCLRRKLGLENLYLNMNNRRGVFVKSGLNNPGMSLRPLNDINKTELKTSPFSDSAMFSTADVNASDVSSRPSTPLDMLMDHKKKLMPHKWIISRPSSGYSLAEVSNVLTFIDKIGLDDMDYILKTLKISKGDKYDVHVNFNIGDLPIDFALNWTEFDNDDISQHINQLICEVIVKDLDEIGILVGDGSYGSDYYHIPLNPINLVHSTMSIERTISRVGSDRILDVSRIYNLLLISNNIDTVAIPKSWIL